MVRLLAWKKVILSPDLLCPPHLQPLKFSTCRCGRSGDKTRKKDEEMKLGHSCMLIYQIIWQHYINRSSISGCIYNCMGGHFVSGVPTLWAYSRVHSSYRLTGIFHATEIPPAFTTLGNNQLVLGNIQILARVGHEVFPAGVVSRARLARET